MCDSVISLPTRQRLFCVPAAKPMCHANLRRSGTSTIRCSSIREPKGRKGIGYHQKRVMRSARHYDRSSPPLPGQSTCKTVRITLPLSPPPELDPMDFAQSSQPRRSERTNVPLSQLSSRVLLPTDVVDEDERLRSGSKWRQHDLAVLKVKFDPDEDSELSVLDVERQWSSSQCQSNFPAWPRHPCNLLTVGGRSQDPSSRTRHDFSRVFKGWSS